MSTPILATKLYIPSPRSIAVARARLIERLNEGLGESQEGRKLTLISAPAGFGKTTLVSEWVTACQRPTAWLSLDEGDSDPLRFLAYLIAALQTVSQNLGAGSLALLQSLQPSPLESILTTLLNEITTLSDKFLLVLDDYHLIETPGVDASMSVDDALSFLVEHLPPQMHLVIATREDPPLPLARLRVRDQLTELRANDLRFTPAEAATFLNQVMGLNLSAEEIAALENRTEGWIAGLQLAALSMRGHQDTADFIESFTGSHHFVLDYLVEEVLLQQSESVQRFLLYTAILDRLCGPLCDALLCDPTASGQDTLTYLERANLFLVPLDNERRWYRYHHLFADLLRQRLPQHAASSAEDEERIVAELHSRASIWFEDNGLEVEAFQHAAAANDIDRAARLVEGEGMPLHFRGVVAPVLSWLASLPTTILDARPSLWVTYASTLAMVGQPISSVEEKLHAAEAVLQDTEPDDKTRDLIGHIAAIRAMLAIPQNEVETIIAQSRRALQFLHPNNVPVRTTAHWTLGFAYQLQGNRAEAGQAYTKVISIGQASGNTMTTIAATICLGQVQEAENQLYPAAESYHRVLELIGDPPLPTAYIAHLGLAQICYEWNDLDTAQKHGHQSLQLGQQLQTVDAPASCRLLLARLKLVQSDLAGAATLLAEAEQFVHQHNFIHQMPDVAALQVITLLHQGDLTAAAHLAEKYELPISRARVYLAQGDTSAALAELGSYRQQVEAKDWADERLKALVLQAVAHQAHGDREQAIQALSDALALAEPGGFIRLFVDEGQPMRALLHETAKQGVAPNYVRQLLAAFETVEGKTPFTQPLIEPLSERELDVLRLLKTELNGPEIARELLVSLNTMRTHTKNIYSKLGVNNRRAAVSRAEELDLL